MKYILNYSSFGAMGRVLLYLFFFIQFISGLGWLMNICINTLTFPFAVFLAFVLEESLFHDAKKTLVPVFLIIGLSIMLAIFITDGSYDGQAYHQLIIYALSNGWNPIHTHHNPIIDSNWGMNIWIDHYEKGLETLSAAIVAFTNNLESGKAINILLGISSFFMCCDTLLYHGYINLKISKVLLYSTLLSFPTIFAVQVFTYYIDLGGYYIILWLIIYFYNSLSFNDYKRYVSLFVIFYVGISIKFNVIFWMFYFSIPFVVFLFYKKIYKQLSVSVFTVVVAVAISLLTITYNPIITNLLDHGNPTYPMGVQKSSNSYLGAGAMPISIENKSRFIQVAIGVFSRPNNEVNATWTPPYEFNKKMLTTTGGTDVKLGGGGVFFCDLIILSFLMLFLNRKYNYYKLLLLIFLLIIAGLFVLPYGGLYRYTPFISFLPLSCVLLSEEARNQSPILKVFHKITLLIIVVNVLISFGSSVAYSLTNKYITSFYVKEIKKNNCPYYTNNWSFCYKVEGDNIKHISFKETELKDYLEIPYQHSLPIYVYKEIDISKKNKLFKNK